MASCLGHLTVLDFSETLGGQYCGRLLADFGARVTLLEPPSGSITRRIGPFDRKDQSHLFRHLNRGKSLIASEIADIAATSRFGVLAGHADVVLVPPGFDLALIRNLNPAAIAVEVSNFGCDGPYAGWQGPEIVLQALSGMMHNNGVFGRAPLYGVGQRAGIAAGIGATIGVLVALLARDETGQCQDVRIEAAETAALMCFPYVVQHLYSGATFSRADLAIPAGQVECRDGWVCIWLYAHRWKALLMVLGLEAIDHDPRFADPVTRRKNWAALFAIIQDRVRGDSAEDLVDRLQMAEIISAKAYRATEVASSRHLAARGYWETDTGSPVLGPPFRMSRTPRGASAMSHEKNARPDLRSAHAENRDQPHLPLAGLRVLELTTAWAGPMAGRILAYFGAEAIHVEGPGRVNTWRLDHEPIKNPINYPDREPGTRPFDRAFLFNSQNINKRSLILDLKTEKGREILRDLALKSDILITNFRPGTLRKLGVDHDTLKRENPGLIVAELPAYGLSGPMSGYAALGPTMEMATGMSAMIGYPDGAPETTGPSYLDPIGGFNAATAILMALVHRRRSGEGQHIEIPQVEAAMQLIGAELLAAAETGIDPVRNGNRVAYAAPHDAYPARGVDQWVAIAAMDEVQWRSLCSAIGQPELTDDSRFADMAARQMHADALDTILSDWTRDRTKHEIADQLQRLGVAAAPVQNPADIAASTYLRTRGFFTELAHPEAGTHRYPHIPIRLNGTPGTQRKAAPCFGADNRYIVETVLGRSPEEYATLVAEGVLSDRPAGRA